MFEFFSLPQNYPFALALLLVLLLLAVELLSSLLGSGLFSALDHLMPDMPDMDADVDHGFLVEGLSWLCFGKVPFIVLLTLFLTSFGLIGLAIQSLLHDLFSLLLPGWLAALSALLLALPPVRFAARAIALIMPREESSAVSQDSFVGKVATLVMGEARKGAPVQARLRDEFGQTHYVLVEPEQEGQVFDQQSRVLLIERRGALFLAVPFTEPF